MREICDPLTDAEIEAVLILIEIDRDAGISKRDEMLGLEDVCWSSLSPTPEVAVWCVSCYALLVDAVYGP